MVVSDGSQLAAETRSGNTPGGYSESRRPLGIRDRAKAWLALVHPCPRQNVIQQICEELANLVWDPDWATRIPIVASSIARQTPSTIKRSAMSLTAKNLPAAQSNLFPGPARRNKESPSATETKQNPVCHLLSPTSAGSCGQFQNPSNTRNTLMSRHPSGLPKAPQFS